MSEIDEENANSGLNQAIQSGLGTPFSLIINWFNEKLKNMNLSDKFEALELKRSINTKQFLTQYFNFLNTYLPKNSCTIVKLNRHPDPGQRPGLLTPGHYVLMSKDINDMLWTYEPYASNNNNCVKRQYKGFVSDNFFNTYQREGYITASLVQINDIKDKMDISGGGDNM
jgi:hypothetical protein